MIRPLTCLAFLLACGSGLYVYQAKHRVKMLDEQITQTIRSTDALREQTRMLSAEWTLLNDPERLRQLANQFLTLQTVSPNQFTSLGDLDSRLPAPVAPGPPPGAAADVVATAAAAPAADRASGTATDEGKPADARPSDVKLVDAPVPAAPKDAASPAVHTPPPARVTTTAAAEPVRPYESKPLASRVALAAPPPRPAVSQPRPLEQRPLEPRASAAVLAEARPVAQTLRAPSPPPMPQPAFQPAGSFLGMAHGMSAPPAPMPMPRPMPISVPQWSSGAGG